MQLYFYNKTTLAKSTESLPWETRNAGSKDLTDWIRLLVHQAHAQPLAVTIAKELRSKPPSVHLQEKMPYNEESIPLDPCGHHLISWSMRLDCPHFSIQILFFVKKLLIEKCSTAAAESLIFHSLTLNLYKLLFNL